MKKIKELGEKIAVRLSKIHNTDVNYAAKGLAIFSNIQELLTQYQVSHVQAIATEAFRKADNGMDFAQQVREKTGIPLHVISQEEEGMIAFYSAVSSSNQHPDNLLLWDIGTGSFQIIAAHDDNKVTGSTCRRIVVLNRKMRNRNVVIRHRQDVSGRSGYVNDPKRRLVRAADS